MYGNLFVVLFLIWRSGSVSSVHLLELRVPTHEREGGTALLGCQYDMEGDSLYSVKWYKDNREFYRYVPKNEPPLANFYAPGVDVDIDRSSSTVVALRNLVRNSEGLYRCEVSGEAPRFEIASSEKYITIHRLPETGPRITGLQDEYLLDDYVNINCTSPASRPAAHLKWLVNEKPVPSHNIRGPWQRLVSVAADTMETTLQLRFAVQPSHFFNGAIKFKCQATIAPLYQRETNSIKYLATMTKPIANESKRTNAESADIAALNRIEDFLIIICTLTNIIFINVYNF